MGLDRVVRVVPALALTVAFPQLVTALTRDTEAVDPSKVEIRIESIDAPQESEVAEQPAGEGEDKQTEEEKSAAEIQKAFKGGR